MRPSFRNSTVFVTISLLTLISSGFSKNNPKHYEDSDKIILEYEFTEPSVSQQDAYDLISMEGLSSYHLTSEPIIPMQAVSVLIPLGKKVINIKATALEMTELSGSYTLPVAQKAYPRSHVGPKETIELDKTISEMDTSWPGTYYRKASTQYKRGYQLLLVNLFPVQYTPETGKVTYANKICLEVQLSEATDIQLIKPTAKVKDQLKKQVANPSILDSYSNEKIKAIEKEHKQKKASSLQKSRGSKSVKAQAVLEDLSRQVQIGESKGKQSTRVSNKGYLRFLSAPQGANFKVDSGKKEAQSNADEFLKSKRDLFVNKSDAVDFKIKKTHLSGPDANKRSFLRYKQVYAGLEVFGAEIIVQVDAEGGIKSVVSDLMEETSILDSGDLVLKASINKKQAQDSALVYYLEEQPELDYQVSQPTLMLYDPSVTGNEGEISLVWVLEISDEFQIQVKEKVLVDAHSGQVVFHFSLIKNALYRKIYDASSWPYVLARQEGDPASGIQDVNDVYDYLADSYDFFYDNHARDSYDDNGSDCMANVLYNDDNAFWDNVSTMYIGVGNAIDDIVAHEFTHAVTQSIVDLTYSGESGSICESLSDMWGEWIDQTNGSGNDSSSVKWRLFEDWKCWNPDYPEWGHWQNNPPCRVWRVMDDPPSVCTDWTYGEDWSHPGDPNYSDFGDLPQPDRYYSPYWYTGTDDGGGNHHNLGVGNKLCYLLTDGGTFEYDDNGVHYSYDIQGMGVTNASKLFYEALNMLTSSADYQDLGNAVVQAAVNLEDELSLSSEDIQNVINACLAVQIRPIQKPDCVYYGAPSDAAAYDYVIITSENLADISDPNNFQALCDSKAAKGLSACIVTTDWIDANYNGDKPSGGEDLQTKIRNFLIDAYESWGTEYCLLAGSDSVVPGRNFYTVLVANEYYTIDYTYPSDLYYACLDPNCTFDYNCDGNYADLNDGFNGGEVDLMSEIYVGRVCIEDSNEVKNFVHKTLTYESTEDSYLDEFRAFAVSLWSGESGWMKPYAENVRDESYYGKDPVQRYGFEKAMQTESLPYMRAFETEPTFYDFDYCNDPNFGTPWDSKTTLVPVLNGTYEFGVPSPHVLYYAGHGLPHNISGGVPNRVVMSVDSVSDPNLSDLNNSQTDRYFFWYIDACQTGKFSVDDCLAEELLCRKDGAFALIASTEDICYSVVNGEVDNTYWPETEMGCEFFDSMLNDSEVPTLSYALQDARENTIISIVGNDSGARMSYFEMTMFGDPEVTLKLQYKSDIENVRKQKCYPTIQAAINDADTGDVIELQPGTYTGQGNRDLDFGGAAITIRSTDSNDANIVAATIIDCDGTRSEPHRGFYFHSGETNQARVEGISITDGYGDLQSGYYAGGAIFCDGSSPTISKCLVYSNTNDAVNDDVDGPIACYNGSDAVIEYCTIRDNTTYYAAAVSVWDSETLIQDCLIYNNSASFGGAFYFYIGGDGLVTNCTVVNNSASYGSALVNDTSTPLIENTIFWGNTAPGGVCQELSYVFGTEYPIFRYCNVEGSNGSGINWQTCMGIDGGGNIDADPLLNTDGYHLEANSPCINAGDSSIVYNGQNDVDGEPRVMGGRVDMGVDEFSGICNVNTNVWYSTISAAVADESTSAVETIEAGPGTYYDNIDNTSAGNDMVITSVDPDDWDIVASTIIDGGGSGTVVTFNSGENTSSLLQGLTIQNGNALNGGGVLVNNRSSANVRKCIIKNNTATNCGGGISAGFLQGPGAIKFSDCIIEGNAAGAYGGGAYVTAFSQVFLDNCLVINNQANNGGGVSQTAYCGAMMNNCTIVNNSAVNNGGGVHGGPVYNNSMNINNSIVWGNTAGVSNDQIQGAYTTIITYSDVQGWPGAGSNGNIDGDPLFVTGLLGDYYLSQIAAGQGADSPCVDSGSTTSVNLGLDTVTTRTDDVTDAGTVDMGYHYPVSQ